MLTVNELVAISAVGTLLIGVVAVIVALKGVRDQLWLHTFAEYTARYNEIAKEIPAAARSAETLYDLDALDAQERGRILNLVRAYVNLCSEEHYLQSKKRIDSQTWDIWKTGIQAMFNYRWFRQAWAELSMEYDGYPEFLRYFDECYRHAGAAPGEETQERDAAASLASESA